MSYHVTVNQSVSDLRQILRFALDNPKKVTETQLEAVKSVLQSRIKDYSSIPQSIQSEIREKNLEIQANYGGLTKIQEMEQEDKMKMLRLIDRRNEIVRKLGEMDAPRLMATNQLMIMEDRLAKKLLSLKRAQDENSMSRVFGLRGLLVASLSAVRALHSDLELKRKMADTARTNHQVALKRFQTIMDNAHKLQTESDGLAEQIEEMQTEMRHAKHQVKQFHILIQESRAHTLRLVIVRDEFTKLAQQFAQFMVLVSAKLTLNDQDEIEPSSVSEMKQQLDDMMLDED